MSIDLAVALPDDASIDVSTFEAELRRNLHALFTPPVPLFVESAMSAWGEDSWTAEIKVGPNAHVELLCHSIGTKGQFGDEAGWWILVSVAYRTDESFLLMLVVAAQLSKTLRVPILDEAAMFSNMRFLDPSRAKELLEQLTGTTFARAAGLLRQHLRKSN